MSPRHAERSDTDEPVPLRRHERITEPAAPALDLATSEEWVLHRVRRHGVGPFVAVMTLVTIAATLVIVVCSLVIVDGFTDRTTWTRVLVFGVMTPAIVGPPILLLAARLVSHLDTATRLLQDSAVTDPLTGVANRRGFFAALGEVDADEEIEVAMVDVDDFKSINDERGHPAGDTALCLVAAWLEELVGDRGTVGRLGGDEFAFVARVDSFRPTPNRMEFRLDGTAFTVSIGTARTRDGHVHGALLAADAELYRQKQARPAKRRRVVRSQTRRRPGRAS